MQLGITPEESAVLDAAAADRIEALMERAGLWVALAAVQMGVGYGSRVAVLAGPGNNGGDAYVAAKYLARRGVAVVVHARGYPKGDYSAARKASTAAVDAGVRVEPFGEPTPADLVIDGLFGAGFHGELPADVHPWLSHTAPVLAIDVPSGLNAADGRVEGEAFYGDRTVTFHSLKVGHLLGEGPERCGPIDVRDIGLDGGTPELRLAEESDVLVPGRSRTAHKWSAGSVLVVGGSPGLTGAVMLAAASALQAGAGAVAAAVPGRWQAALEGMSAGVMTRGIGTEDRFDPSDVAELLAQAARFDVLALGPGLGPEQEKFVAELVSRWDGKLLIDADGLNAIVDPGRLRRAAGTLITPHAGEFRRLTSDDATYGAASSLAGAQDVVVLLKGNPTFVAGSGAPWVIVEGGPELATIGTGDVLTGAVAALWAGGLDAEDAAVAGAFWHGRAGRSLAARTVVTAEKLVDEIGAVLR
ncbi:MAG: NAD(P)H-hydrate dehydratase [Acidimicrobiia bacterium]|nr:NAD(P)H-hydrate dehydratase [Acidimicrobiia bacterium]